MRTVTFGGACSLDGFFARGDDGVDWLRWSDDVQKISAEFWKTIDTLLMGRRTYEVAVAAGTSAYPGVRNVVFSRTLRDVDPRVEVVAGDPAAFVAAMKSQEGRGIGVLGGGMLARTLFDHGLIDEVGMNVHPILLGGGIPFYPGPPRDVTLELLRSEVLKHGCVYLLYRVRRSDTARAATGPST